MSGSARRLLSQGLLSREYLSQGALSSDATDAVPAVVRRRVVGENACHDVPRAGAGAPVAVCRRTESRLLPSPPLQLLPPCDQRGDRRGARGRDRRARAARLVGHRIAPPTASTARPRLGGASVGAAYATALGLTLLIEMPAYASVLRCGLNISVRRGLAAGAAVNLISHPVAFLSVMPALDRPLGFFAALAATEAGVWVL